MKKKVALLYIGDRTYGIENRGVFIEDGKALTEENMLTFKSGKYTIGSYYEAEKDTTADTMSLYTKALIKDKHFEDAKLLKQWRLEAKAAITHKKIQLQKSRVDNNPLPQKLIEELRAEVSCLGHNDAVAFLNYLVDEILFKPMQDQMNRRMQESFLKGHIKKLKRKGA